MERRREHEEGALFQDPGFPAENSSLFSCYSTPISEFRSQISWLRPQEQCESPRLFSPIPQESHVKQGILGDCWFLCACTMLEKNRHLLDKVFPPGQAEWGDQGYSGRFCFRFWQFGCWVEVEVDDRLPCIAHRLCFSHCRSSSVFWVSLLEKAYAKLRGSYERLWAGQVAEALVDLTGGLAERWSLKDCSKEKEEWVNGNSLVPEKLALDSLVDVKDGCVMSCSVHSSPGGASELGEYHAYSVMEWVDVKLMGGHRARLLRIRNPWGRRCQGGPFGASGQGWGRLEPDSAAHLLSHTEEDEFWVEEEEFFKEFDEVTVGYPIDDNGHLRSLHTGKVLTHSQQVHGSWVKGHSAGGCRNNSSYVSNPKFWLRVCEAGEVLVSVLQQCVSGSSENCKVEGRQPGGSTEQHQHCQAIGLHIWKVEKRCLNLQKTLSKTPCVFTHCHAYDREVTLHCHLSPGYYLVIPSTFLQDFLSHSVVKPPPSPVTPMGSLSDGEWETSSLEGKWLRGESTGGSRNFPTHLLNPRLPLTIASEPGHPNARITLRQHCPPGECQAIGFHIYQVLGGTEDQDQESLQDQEPQASCVPHCYTQEVSMWCSLSPGRYIIVPSTYQPDCEGCFTVTISTKIDSWMEIPSSSILDIPVPPQPKPAELNTSSRESTERAFRRGVCRVSYISVMRS
ncbi:CAN10 protein, partial [Polyodon spathula]|nr:CAN10 protein [Polyodon spathula]